MTAVDMEPYRWSAGVERLRDELDRYGYVAIRGLLDVDPLRAAADRTGEMLARAGLGVRRPAPLQPLFRVEATVDERVDIEYTLMSDESLEAVFHAPAVLKTVRAAWGGEEQAFVHPTKVVRAVAPEGTEYHSRAGLHQDLPEIQGGARQLTMWCPLTEVDAATGALPVYPGSHLHGVLPLTLAENPSGWAVRPDALRAAASTVHCGRLVPGDVLLMSALTVHGDARNTADGWRLSVEGRFQPLVDPVAAPVLELPGRGYGWDDLYAGWRELAYYWRDRQPPVVAYDDSWERWRDVQALAGPPGVADRALEIAAGGAPNRWIRETARRMLDGPGPGEEPDVTNHDA